MSLTQYASSVLFDVLHAFPPGEMLAFKELIHVLHDSNFIEAVGVLLKLATLFGQA